VLIRNGADARCSFNGAFRREESRLQFSAATAECAEGGAAFGSQRLIDVGPNEFVMAASQDFDAISRQPNGMLVGPVWVFKRARLSGGP
jgi:hypothetical protein